MKSNAQSNAKSNAQSNAKSNGQSDRTSERGRFSAKKKSAAVLRLLHGESLDNVSREIGVTAATLSGWRDRFLAAAELGLKERDNDAREDENRRLKSKIGELMMTQELLQEQIERTIGSSPFAVRKSWNR